MHVTTKILLIAFLGLGLYRGAWAQGEINEEQQVYFRDERSFSGVVNSNGYGINFRYARAKDAVKRKLYEVDWCEIKHPSEIKISSTQYNASRFVLGKMNNCYNFRFGLGRITEMITKHDKGSISISSYQTYGISLALLKPIYYEISRGDTIQTKEKFNESAPPNQQDILGRAEFTRGFNEIKPCPGIFFKYGYSFEFSKQDKQVSAIECGIQADAFLRKIQIMAVNEERDFVESLFKDNRYLFFSLFVSYRFGKIIER